MKEQPRAEVTHFEIAYLNKMKILQVTQKLLYEKFYVHTKIYAQEIYQEFTS